MVDGPVSNPAFDTWSGSPSSALPCFSLPCSSRPSVSSSAIQPGQRTSSSSGLKGVGYCRSGPRWNISLTPTVGVAAAFRTISGACGEPAYRQAGSVFQRAAQGRGHRQRQGGLLPLALEPPAPGGKPGVDGTSEPGCSGRRCLGGRRAGGTGRWDQRLEVRRGGDIHYGRGGRQSPG